MKAVIQLDASAVLRQRDLEEFLDPLTDFQIVDHDARQIGAVRIAHGARDEIAFGVQLHGGGLAHLSLDIFPQPREVSQIALDLLAGFTNACRANDEADVFDRFEAVENHAESAALFIIFDLAADAHLLEPRHHHENAAGNGQIGAERRALGADAFLDDLHDDLIAAAQAALNGRAVAAGEFAADRFLKIAAVSAEITGHQIGDMQKSVAAEPEVDERRLDGGFDVGDAAFVDVADVAGRAGALHV